MSSHSQALKLNFVLFPLMSQGHMIPMMDIAKTLSQQGVTVTVITTHHNASRFESTFARSTGSGSQIRLAEVQFPYQEAGLPEGCENLDMLPSLGTSLSFFNAANSNALEEQVEKLFQELIPPPSCIISDMCLHYTATIATKFNIPRISFLGQSCFSLFCLHNIGIHRSVLSSITSETEYFVFPGLPDKVEMTKAQIPTNRSSEEWNEFYAKTAAAEGVSYGVVMNTFEELEPAYARGYNEARNGKVWCVGPVSLSNKGELEKAGRGNKASIDQHYCMKWLDLQKPRGVIYVCLGSISNMTSLQLVELGLSLEASNRPFIWVIREGGQLEALEKWIKEDEFEERTKDRSLVIRGWAPQVLILSHPAIGGFLTHCGWNSTLEAICAGVPMVTWPLFGDQFFNEKLIVQILRVGVKVGVEVPLEWGEEEKGLLVEKEDVERAINELMDESRESEEMRERVQELAEMAKKAVEEGGSSHTNLTLLIQDIMMQQKQDINE